MPRTRPIGHLSWNVGGRPVHKQQWPTTRSVGFDDVDGRTDWFTPWGGPPDVRTIVIDPVGTLFAHVHVGNITRSTDGGQTWHATAMDILADVHDVHADSVRPGHLLAATGHGLAETQDGGESWQFDASGLHATYARAVVQADETILMSVSNGPDGHKSAIYRHERSSGWQKAHAGLPEWFNDNIDTHKLIACANHVMFAVDERIYTSGDAGRSWTQVTNVPRNVHGLTIWNNAV